MKFTRTLTNIFIALTIIAIVSVSSRSSRSKTRVAADVVAPIAAKLIEYEATLLIKDASTSVEHSVKIDQESFNQMNYGIQFALEKGAIIHPAFFVLPGNTYLFDFKYAHSINCLNQAMFTQKAMHFSVYVANKTWDVVFTFPNGWAFGNSVNLANVCNKFYEKWTNTQKVRSSLTEEIMSLFSHIKIQEMQRTRNMNTKSALTATNNQYMGQVGQLNNTIIGNRASINKINQEIDTIGQKSGEEAEKLEKIETEIREHLAKMATQQQFIDDTNGNLSEITKISESEISSEWSSFKVALEKMISIQSSEDPLKAKLQNLVSNPSGNVNAIMNLL